MRKLVLASAVAVVAALSVSSANAGNPVKGKDVYETNCAACHGATGTAVMPGTPDFQKRERLDKPDGKLLASIRNGLNIMPAWAGQLSNDEMSSALAYIRTLAR